MRPDAAAPPAPVQAPAPDTVRDAATVILLRRQPGATRILMGMRGENAVFMPSKFVFPGGAVDPCDLDAAPLPRPDPRLLAQPRPGIGILPHALLACARRELAEETGLILRADARPLFVFRAITPPGLSRRFDARFFLCDADDVEGDPDDFSDACDELSHLHWVQLAEARALALPFITEVVLAEIGAMLDLAGTGRLPHPASVPFFDNRGPEPRFSQLT